MLQLAIALALMSGSGSDDGPRRDSNFVLHEWGTFTTVAGSNGVQIGGLTYDEESLPRFVYERNHPQRGFQHVNVKMETPVIYIYSDEEREVSLKVGFPKGLLTQWYPQVRALDQGEKTNKTDLKNGLLDWGTFMVLAPNRGLDLLPVLEKGDSWQFARQTKANVLRNCAARVVGDKVLAEHERFLFYRGLGDFELPVRASAASDASVTVENRGTDPLERFVGLRVTKDKIYFRAFEPLAAGAKTSIDTELDEVTIDGAMDEVAALLAQAGLYKDEARAMVNTWRKSYFQTEGFRILYFVPRRLTDQILPLTVDPAPKETVRVLVGRLDVLLPAQEEKAKKTIKSAKTIEQARLDLGRFAEPIVRHLRDTTNDPDLRARATALLATEDTGR